MLVPAWSAPALFLVVNTTLRGLSSPGLVYFCHSQFVPTHFKTLGFLTGTPCLCSSFSFPLSFPPVGLGERCIRTRYFSSFLLKETRSFYSEAKHKISDIKSSTMPKGKEAYLERLLFLQKSSLSWTWTPIEMEWTELAKESFLWALPQISDFIISLVYFS